MLRKMSKLGKKRRREIWKYKKKSHILKLKWKRSSRPKSL